MDTDTGFDLSTVFQTSMGAVGPGFEPEKQRVAHVDIAGVKLRLLVAGEGPPLLFLFGSGAAATIENAQPLVNRLSHAFTVACPDQRGLGMSDVPPGPWTMADYAADAFGVADYLGWERFSLLGLSFGGMVALEMAATNPDRLERLVLWGTSPGGSAPSYPLHELDRLPQAERFRIFPGILDTRLRDRQYRTGPTGSDRGVVKDRISHTHTGAGGEDPIRVRGLAMQLDARRGHDVTGRLDRLECPTFIGAGRFDGLAPLENALVLQAEIPHAELHVYEAGHLFFAELDGFRDSLRFLTGAAQSEPTDNADTYFPPHEWRNVADLVADRAERTPDAIAIRCDGQSHTYAELTEASHRLARLLIERGVGPDSIVPVLIGRSPHAVVAMLAVLAAGGAYLPMDPGGPLERLKSMARDSDAELVLTVLEHASRAASLDVGESVLLDDPDLQEALAGRSAARVSDRDRRAVLTAKHPAFVVYSSGSTGVPKGSLNTHAGLENTLEWFSQAHEIGPEDRVLHQSALTFDIVSAEVFLPLINGGTLVIASPGRQADPRYIAELVRAEAVTWAFFVPSLLKFFLDGTMDGAFESLRHMVCGGEVLTGRLVSYCHSRLPAVTLWNVYGPSETAIILTMWRCRRADADADPPLGHAGPGSRLHILGDDLQPVAPGAVGELFVSGTPVSLGYLQRYDLTAASFLPCSWGSPDARMYRTGDLVARRDDGALVFHGRVDDQIKINGVRVEPGEIEAAIAAIPGISEVVVISRSLAGSARLIAYVIVEPGAPAPEPAAMNSALARRLPLSMIPEFFLALNQFPRTASGKIATRELPDPEFATKELQEDRTEDERLVYDLWTEVLGHRNFDVDDNFFMVGGRSLAAAQLQVRLEAYLGCPVPLSWIYGSSTIREQAKWLSGSVPDFDDCLVTLKPHGNQVPIFAIHGWGGTVDHFADVANALPDRPVIGIQFVGRDPGQTSVMELAAQYADRILRYQPVGAINLTGLCVGSWYAYAVAAALIERGAEIGMFAVLDASERGARIHPQLQVRLTVPKLRELVSKEGGARIFSVLRRVGTGFTKPRRRARSAGPAMLGEPDDDAFVALSRKGFRPPRLPISVYLVGPPGRMHRLRCIWRFYVAGEVKSVPLFNKHSDFWDPKFASELAVVLDQALRDVKAASTRAEAP